MRFHCLGVPHTVTSPEYVACAFTQKILKFCKMMKAKGHYTIHYGHEDSVLDCDEHVSVLTNKDFEECYGHKEWRNTFFKYDLKDSAYTTFYVNAIREIGFRKQKNDFILPFWGCGGRTICEAHHDLICVEPGIGYSSGHWARWKIFESYALLHAYLGINAVTKCIPEWYNTVVPNYFDLDDFEYSEEKDDYFLFLGRVYDGKGIHVAIELTEKIGAKLIVAGQNTLKKAGYPTTPPHVTEIGYVLGPERKKLLSRAKGVITASMFIEPFCGVHVEALLSGTPVISTDWGIFTETIINGINGFRCRTFGDFVEAANKIHTISPKKCRESAMKFTLENVAPQYEKFFTDVLNVYTGKGWYELNTTVPGATAQLSTN